MRHTYTEYSAVAALHLWLLCREGPFKDCLLDYAAVNSCAILLAFHAAALLRPSPWSALQHRLHMSARQFLVANCAVHIMPCALLLLRTYTSSQARHQVQGRRTAYLHLAWALLTQRGLDLSRVYVPMPMRQQLLLWSIALTGHWSGARLVNRLRQRPRAADSYCPPDAS